MNFDWLIEMWKAFVIFIIVLVVLLIAAGITIAYLVMQRG